MTATRKQVTIEGGGVRRCPVTSPFPMTLPGLVLFAHGSGSSRRSPRNRAVAASLNEAGFCTLLFDLLTAGARGVDARTGDLRFDIPLLARRLTMAVDWLDGSAERTRRLPYGLFGASTGAAAALVTAGSRPRRVRGGGVQGRPSRPGGSAARGPARPHPAHCRRRGHAGARAQRGDTRATCLTAAPWRSSMARATCFQPGAIDQVAALTADWFTRHVGGRRLSG